MHPSWYSALLASDLFVPTRVSMSDLAATETGAVVRLFPGVGLRSIAGIFPVPAWPTAGFALIPPLSQGAALHSNVVALPAGDWIAAGIVSIAPRILGGVRLSLAAYSDISASNPDWCPVSEDPFACATMPVDAGPFFVVARLSVSRTLLQSPSYCLVLMSYPWAFHPVMQRRPWVSRHVGTLLRVEDRQSWTPEVCHSSSARRGWRRWKCGYRFWIGSGGVSRFVNSWLRSRVKVGTHVWQERTFRLEGGSFQ